MENKVYIIWIGWIWVSAIARYYLSQNYEVHGSDLVKSELTDSLKKEWVKIIIWESSDTIDDSFSKIIYTEAVKKTQSELVKANELWIKTLTYPESLWSIANNKKLITIAWTHGKSTTTSLLSLIFKNSKLNFTSIVWTILKEFDNKNFYHRSNQEDEDFFIVEACEYKRSFLKYKPTVAVILNIELDHLDYYKDWNDYMLAYKQYLDNVISWGFAIINWEDLNCKKLVWIRKDINYIIVYWDHLEFNWEKHGFPTINLKIPWNHTLYDAKVAYTVWHMLWIHDLSIITSLEKYEWVWRRMEDVWFTKNKNLVVSDYWHHPTEIALTLPAIKQNNPDKKIITIFQPHQYNRTIELIEWFKNCFNETDTLIIPNIYESRDSESDKQKMNTEKLLSIINHKNKHNGNWFKNTIEIINDLDNKNPNSLVFILLWAWDIDDLRYDLVK